MGGGWAGRREPDRAVDVVVVLVTLVGVDSGPSSRPWRCLAAQSCPGRQRAPMQGATSLSGLSDASSCLPGSPGLRDIYSAVYLELAEMGSSDFSASKAAAAPARHRYHHSSPSTR